MCVLQMDRQGAVGASLHFAACRATGHGSGELPLLSRCGGRFGSTCRAATSAFWCGPRPGRPGRARLLRLHEFSPAGRPDACRRRPAAVRRSRAAGRRRRRFPDRDGARAGGRTGARRQRGRFAALERVGRPAPGDRGASRRSTSVTVLRQQGLSCCWCSTPRRRRPNSIRRAPTWGSRRPITSAPRISSPRSSSASRRSTTRQAALKVPGSGAGAGAGQVRQDAHPGAVLGHRRHSQHECRRLCQGGAGSGQHRGYRHAEDRFRLPESYLAQLKPGQQLEVSSDALPGQVFTAVLDAINPLVEAGGRAIALRASLPNGEARLRPGMFVRVRLIFEQRNKVLLIPEQALIPDSKAPYVYRVVDGRAKRTPVRHRPAPRCPGRGGRGPERRRRGRHRRADEAARWRGGARRRRRRCRCTPSARPAARRNRGGPGK
jgi:hypothetical protein